MKAKEAEKTGKVGKAKEIEDAKEAMAIARMAEIVKEVRECDRAILNWLTANGVLSPNDYYRISRPSLVMTRLNILSRLNIVGIDGNGNAYLRSPIGVLDIDSLPVNSDRIRIGPKICLVVYKIICEYSPITIEEIRDILAQMFGRKFHEDSVGRWIGRLKKYNLIRKEDGKYGKYVPVYNLLTDDYDTLYSAWLRETSRSYEICIKYALPTYLRNLEKRKKTGMVRKDERGGERVREGKKGRS